MSESLEDSRLPEAAAGTSGEAAQTAGAMIRQARERQGVHIAVLAAAIKVSPRKLDALENDRYDELPDATFTRALAQTVCRALKLDVAPVLARLPQAGPSTPLEQVSAGLNTPFREKPGLSEGALALPSRPWVWSGVALLLAAVAVLLWPVSRTESSDPTPGVTGAPELAASAASAPSSDGRPLAAEQPVASAPSVAASAGAPVASAPVAIALPAAPAVETVHAAPPQPPTGRSDQGASLVTTDASWVEVIDGGGQTLLSRIVQPGETVTVDGPLPMRLKVGNARATRLVFRGQPVELEAFTRDNVARVELK